MVSPTGRRIVDTKMTKMYLKKYNSEITVQVIVDDEAVVDSIKMI